MHDLGRQIHLLVLAPPRDRHAGVADRPARLRRGRRPGTGHGPGRCGPQWRWHHQEFRADRARATSSASTRRWSSGPNRATGSPNFEPNYLAFVEFFDEDFVWRYTPARPNGEKLRPWLALLVLEAPDDDPTSGEFEMTNRQNPLRSVRVTAPAALPPLAQNWALAHVHINEGHANPSDFEKFLVSLRRARLRERRQDHQPAVQPPQARRRTPPIAASSCRRSRPVGWLGSVRARRRSTRRRRVGRKRGVELPVYYEWYFRTGENEDFESLVKRLEPRPVDKRVGIRDMDGSTRASASRPAPTSGRSRRRPAVAAADRGRASKARFARPTPSAARRTSTPPSRSSPSSRSDAQHGRRPHSATPRSASIRS